MPLSGLRYLAVTDSTNTEAVRWAEEGAPDLSVVVADAQTAGRGRAGRRWYTPAGAGLAVSVVLRPAEEAASPLRLTGLGAVCIAQALRQSLGLAAQVKWPNDVLLEGRKVAGVLVETAWQGADWQYAVLGMGVNVRSGAALPDVRFPATDIESVLGRRVPRAELLYVILERLVGWRHGLAGPDFLQTWEMLLAYRGETITLEMAHPPHVTGTLLGLCEDGALRLRLSDGRERAFSSGEMVHLRPIPLA
ncbi:MAG: hypothetical protein Fur0018_09690 [Anaerolineales bacterium]